MPCLRRLADYELLEEVARGGMGIVFRARQLSLGRIVAVKLMRDSALARPEEVKRFRTEAASAAKLNHPNIVAIHEVGEHEGQHFFAMELVEGINLAERTRHGPMSPREAAAVVATIARAVQHAHAQGVLHRDLKPSNVVLDTTGKPFITDFGLAQVLDAGSSLTAVGQVVGTPAYMPPEQASGGGSVGPSADIYSLGAILFHLLAGRAPFMGGSPSEILRSVIEQEAPSLRSINACIDRDLETICLKCLEKEPARRYPSASALADDLERWLRSEPITARPARAWERASKWTRRHPAVAALAGVSGVAILALVGIFALERLRQTEQGLRIETQAALLKAEQAQRAEVEARDLESEHRKRAEQAHEAEARQRQRAEVEAGKAAANFYAATIAWADRNLQDNDAHGASIHLDECPASQRHWEWHYLRSRCNAALRSLRGHASPVVGATFVAGAGHLASLSSDGLLLNWDTGMNTHILNTSLWTKGINKAAFSQNGSRLLIDGMNDDFVRVFDAGSGKEIVAIAPAMNGFDAASVSMSANGELIAVATRNDKLIRIWNVATRQVVRTLAMGLAGDAATIYGMAFNPDATLLAWGSGYSTGLDSSIVESPDLKGGLWVSALADGSEPVSLGTIGTLALATAFSPDGRWLAAGRGDKTVQLWNLKETPITNGAPPVRILRQHTRAVLSLAFSGASTQLASGGADRNVVHWDVVSGKPIRTYLGHSSTVTTLAFHPTENLLVSGSEDGAVHVWNLVATPQPIVIQGASEGLAFSPDGKRLTSGNSAWSALDGTLLFTRDGTGRRGRPAFSPDGAFVANGLRIFNAKDGTEITALQVMEASSGFGSPYGVSFSPDGNAIAFGKGDTGPGDMQIRELGSGQGTRTFHGHTNAVWDVAFSPDGRHLASASGAWQFFRESGGPGEARLWDVACGESLQIHGTAMCLYSVAFSGDGHRFAASGGIYHPANKSKKRGEIFVWDSQTGRELLAATGLSSCVYSIALSPDGKRLVAAIGPFGELGPFDVKLWDVEVGREVLTLGRHERKVHGVAFSPDGKRIASGSLDGVIKIWSIE